MGWKRTALALTTAALAAGACGDSTGPQVGNDQAVVVGRVDQTAPEGSAYPVARDVVSGASASASATTVTVGRLNADGTLDALAEADVQADGSFRVEGVPVNEDHLVVVARSAAGEAVGRATVYGRTAAGTTVTAAPITYQTTVQTLTYARLKAMGRAEATSSEEVALLVRPDAAASATLLANGELDAAADGAAMASETMTSVFAQAGASVDAQARAGLLADAATHFATAVYQGTSASDAFEGYMESALDAYGQAGVSMEVVAQATAGAATTFDADVRGQSSVRGELVAEAVRMNLKARERLAANFQSSAQGSVALNIMKILASTEADLRGATTAAEIRSSLDAGASAAADATVTAVVDLLVPNATVLVQDDVRAKAEAAVEAATLSTSLSSAADADAAAQATAGYHARVRTAVQAMLDAAGRTDVDVEAMTSLYIAAHGGAYIQAS